MQNDRLDVLAHPASLTLAGLGTAVGSKGLYDAYTMSKALSDWEADTNKLKSLITANKNVVDGLHHQTTAAQADQIYENYYKHRNKLLNKSLFGFKVKNLLRNSDIYHIDPSGFMNDLGKGKGSALAEFFKDSIIGTKAIGKHNSDKKNLFINFDDISPAGRKVLKNVTSIEEAGKALGELADVDPKYKNIFNRFTLGHASTGSGLAELVNGSDYVSGNAQKYFKYGKNALNRLKGGAGALAGLSALALGVGGYKALNDDDLAKQASLSEDTKDAVTGGLSLASIAAGGLMTPEAIAGAKLLKDNNNIGFSFGAYGDIGDGHKAPANNLRALIDLNGPNGAKAEAYLRELGISDKEIKRIKKLKLVDLLRNDAGINVATPEKFNTVINTGMGHNAAAYGAQDGLSSDWVGRTNFGGVDRRVYQQAKDLNADTVINYLTDLSSPHTDGGGASLEANRITRLKGNRDTVALTYGDSDAMHGIDKRTGNINAKYNLAKRLADDPNITQHIHINNGAGIAPALSQDTVKFLERYPNRDAAANALSEALADQWEGFDKVQGSGHNASRLKDLLDFRSKGGKIITIAGSGRGDYTLSRAVALMEALERKGIDSDKVRVVPLLGSIANQADFAAGEGHRLTNKLADKLEQAYGKRLTALTALYPNSKGVRPYDLVQAMSDLNLASTGTSALAEAAHSGNLNFIPTQWSDAHGGSASQLNRWMNEKAKEDLLTGLLGDEDVKLQNGTTRKVGKIGFHAPELDSWNRGNMEQAILHDNFRQFQGGAVAEGQTKLTSNVLNRQRKLAKRLTKLFGGTIKKHDYSPDKFAERITNQGFDMDSIVDLINDNAKLKGAQQAALDTALANVTSTKNAQRDIVRTIMGKVQRNNLLNKAKGIGLMSAPAAFMGLGTAGLYNTFKHNQESFKQNMLNSIPTIAK